VLCGFLLNMHKLVPEGNQFTQCAKLWGVSLELEETVGADLWKPQKLSLEGDLSAGQPPWVSVLKRNARLEGNALGFHTKAQVDSLSQC